LNPDDRFKELENIDIAEAAAATRRRTVTILAVGSVIGAGAAAFFGWRLARKRLHLPVFPVFVERTLAIRGFEIPTWIRHWADRVRMTPIEKAYSRMNQALRRLGEPPPASATPGERALAVGELLPRAEYSAGILVTEYEHEIYSTEGGDADKAQDASKAIRKFSWEAVLNRLLREDRRKGQPRPGIGD
jgi:hypothetical protein